jgi:sarcosine oxidase subunit beta
VVDAAGPFAPNVARLVGVELPIETVRRQKVVLAAPGQVPPRAPMTIDVDNGAYWRPEAGGALAGWVDPDEPPTPAAEDLPTDWDFPAVVMERLARLTPFWRGIAAHLKASDVHVSAGHYAYTPDDQPLLGPEEQVGGFYLNCGYWAGVMLSPEAGRWVCSLILGEMDPAQNPLRISRFAEGAAASGGSLLRGHH